VQLLTLAGYRVEVGPGLTTLHAGPADDPRSGYRLGDQLRAATEALADTLTCDAAADLTDEVAHDARGLLPALARFLQAAGQQALAAGTDPARRLASDFEEAADAVAGIAMRLAGAAEHLRRLSPPEPPVLPAADTAGTLPLPPAPTNRPRTR
jgi:hypothetical protein